MATWAEFASGPTEVADGPEPQGGAAGWAPFAPGGRALAEAGERLLALTPHRMAYLATVGADGRPRLHPFMPHVVDGRLWAFVGHRSPKGRDLAARPFAMHTPDAPEDEEFWAGGRARRVDDPELVRRLAAVMEWAKPDHEALWELDLDRAGWTVWLDFGTARHRPRHHRWRALGAVR